MIGANANSLRATSTGRAKNTGYFVGSIIMSSPPSQPWVAVTVSAILINCRRPRQIFPARAPSSGQKWAELRENMYDVAPGYDRTAFQQAGFQLLALVVTLGISIVSGLITGMCVIDFRVAPILGARAREERHISRDDRRYAEYVCQNLEL